MKIGNRGRITATLAGLLLTSLAVSAFAQSAVLPPTGTNPTTAPLPPATAVSPASSQASAVTVSGNGIVPASPVPAAANIPAPANSSMPVPGSLLTASPVAQAATPPTVAGVQPAIVPGRTQGADKPVAKDFDSVIQRLKDGAGSGGTTTLGDVAAAQDALARLDLLLDMEKKLDELNKEHNARVGATSHDDSLMAGMPHGMPSAAVPPMPSAVFGMPAGMQAINAAASPAAMGGAMPGLSPRGMGSGEMKVTRILGGSGHLRAFIDSGDGEDQAVTIGDKLDGWRVANISASGVRLTTSKGKSKFLPVKVDGIPVTLSERSDQ